MSPRNTGTGETPLQWVMTVGIWLYGIVGTLASTIVLGVFIDHQTASLTARLTITTIACIGFVALSIVGAIAGPIFFDGKEYEGVLVILFYLALPSVAWVVGIITIFSVAHALLILRDI